MSKLQKVLEERNKIIQLEEAIKKNTEEAFRTLKEQFKKLGLWLKELCYFSVEVKNLVRFSNAITQI
ncbi:hypothetical protein [Mesobacillus jeotgali]|uniref:hypothetical protein n=1 Tax=Mesobacillus jeotgali TaxID=129985 RepID=UPI0017854AFD|nr:hypothetical protein [Mesobacillus jeotgali]UYZ23279.1 hypothetical protein FOF60_06970 [Mesobacillus jeotgali]